MGSRGRCACAAHRAQALPRKNAVRPVVGHSQPNATPPRAGDNIMFWVCSTLATSAWHAQLRAHGLPNEPACSCNRRPNGPRGVQRHNHVIQSMVGPEEKHKTYECPTTGGVPPLAPLRYHKLMEFASCVSWSCLPWGPCNRQGQSCILARCWSPAT